MAVRVRSLRWLVVLSVSVCVVVAMAGSASGLPSGGAHAFAGPVQGGPSPLAWWKADAITGVGDGGAVSSWPDSSGGGYAATQTVGSKQPVFKAGVVNGLPVVRFNGTSSVLQTSVSDGLAQMTVVALVNFATSMGSTGALIGASGNGGAEMQVVGATDPSDGAATFNLVKQQIAPIAVGQQAVATGAHILTFSYDGSEARLYIDGRLMASGQNAQTLASTTLWIGGDGSNSEYLGADIGGGCLARRGFSVAVR